MRSPDLAFDIHDFIDPPDGRLYDLVDGVRVDVTPSVQNCWIATCIASRLSNAARRGEVGWAFNRLTLDCFGWRRQTLRRPAACYVTASRLPTLSTQAVLPIAPELCVDVISSDDCAEAIERRMEDYFRAGVALVWHVYPETRTIHVFRPDGGASVLREGQALTGSDVLPGFLVAVADVFPPRPA